MKNCNKLSTFIHAKYSRVEMKTVSKYFLSLLKYTVVYLLVEKDTVVRFVVISYLLNSFNKKYVFFHNKLDNY